MGRKTLSKADCKGVSQRLKAHLKARGLTRQALGELADAGPSTVTGWLHNIDPTLPDTASVVVMAEAENLNLNWLLMGKGPRLREAILADNTLPARLRAAVVSAMMANTGVTEAHANEILPDGDRLLEEFVGLWSGTAAGTVIAVHQGDPEELERQCKAVLHTIRNQQHLYAVLGQLRDRAYA